MDVIETMIHKALRDDATATIGIRALLAQTTTTPYGVYHANEMPDNPDFSGGKKYITHFQLTGEFNPGMYPTHNHSTIPKEETYQITVYGGDATTSNDKILNRIRYILEQNSKITKPTTDAQVFKIACEWEGPEVYDEEYEIYLKNSRFRVWLQDISVTG